MTLALCPCSRTTRHGGASIPATLDTNRAVETVGKQYWLTVVRAAVAVVAEEGRGDLAMCA